VNFYITFYIFTLNCTFINLIKLCHLFAELIVYSYYSCGEIQIFIRIDKIFHFPRVRSSRIRFFGLLGTIQRHYGQTSWRSQCF